MPIAVRRVTDPNDPAIAAFGRLQERAYFEPDALIPAVYIGSMLSSARGARSNFLLVAEEDGAVVGGTLFHLLDGPDSGFSSFLATAPELRGRGVARLLHDARFRTLDGALGRPVPGVFIDVVNPARLTPEERAAERAVGSDPEGRRRAFARLGFGQVDVRYEQPVGGENGGPVTNMDLLYCPHPGPPAPPATVPTALVVGTMRAYWSGWLGEARAARFAKQLEERAGGRAELPLLPPI